MCWYITLYGIITGAQGHCPPTIRVQVLNTCVVIYIHYNTCNYTDGKQIDPVQSRICIIKNEIFERIDKFCW